MSLKQKFVSALTLAFAVLGLSIFASAQDKPADTGDQARPAARERRGGFGHKGEGRGMHKGMRGGPGAHMLRGLHGLDLTDAQKEQVRGIMESNRANFEQTREQLRPLHEARRNGTITAEQQTQLDNIRTQMRQNGEAMHQQILGILTPEQRAKLEARKAEMEKRREEFREERRERGPRKERTEKPVEN